MARLICGEKGNVLFCDSGETIVKENGEEKKQTNADRIRSMNDEELAELLAGNNFHCLNIEQDIECQCGDCQEHWLKWLQSEVEG